MPEKLTEMSHALYELSEALDAFVAAHNDTVIGTSRVINPLLVLWEAAHRVSEAAAAPVERMLTVLVSRQHTSHVELQRMVDEVKATFPAEIALASPCSVS